MPTATTTALRKLLTADDYRRTPLAPPAPRIQLIEGEFIEMPAPNRLHQVVIGNLFFSVENYLREHPIGVIYLSPFDVYLDEHNVFQPDLTYVAIEQEDILVPEGVAGPPALVVEVHSPTNRPTDERRKRAIYARVGVRTLWHVEPEGRVVNVFDLAADSDEPTGTVTEAGTLTTPLLPGWAVPVAEVFRQRLGVGR